jgi:hypothetical protein
MTLRIPEYVSWFACNGSVVLIDRRTKKRSELKDAAAALWIELARTGSEDQLVRALAARTEEPEAEVRDYVRDWARSLRVARLLYPLAPEERR